jgi:hypothetical protein
MIRLIAFLSSALVLIWTVHDGLAAGFNHQNASITVEKPVRANAIIHIADRRASQGGTPRDQYRQMGFIAAIAEACYESIAIPGKLNALIKAGSERNPSSIPAINLLIEEYNEAYNHAVTTRTVWNGSKQSYTDTPFDCAVGKDVEMIKAFETNLLVNLR